MHFIRLLSILKKKKFKFKLQAFPTFYKFILHNISSIHFISIFYRFISVASMCVGILLMLYTCCLHL